MIEHHRTVGHPEPLAIYDVSQTKFLTSLSLFTVGLFQVQMQLYH